jgi:hypothetical protein
MLAISQQIINPHCKYDDIYKMAVVRKRSNYFKNNATNTQVSVYPVNIRYKIFDWRITVNK